MKKIFLFFLTALFSVAFVDAQTISATALKNAAVGAFGKYQPTGANTATPGYGVPLKVGSDGGVLPSSDPLPPSAPTLTPTPTFTWNATTTRTQPPTSTPTATNTPDMYRSDVRYIRFSDYPTPLSNLVIPAASPTPIVFAATTPGYHHKIEACAQNIGTAAGVLTAGGMTFNFSPYDPRTLFLFTPANGAITIDTSYVAGVTIRLNLMHAIVRDGQ